MNQKSRENALRRIVAKEGLVLKKSRQKLSSNNIGGYMIIDSHNNTVVVGQRYSYDLDQVDNFLFHLSLKPIEDAMRLELEKYGLELVKQFLPTFKGYAIVDECGEKVFEGCNPEGLSLGEVEDYVECYLGVSMPCKAARASYY